MTEEIKFAKTEGKFLLLRNKIPLNENTITAFLLGVSWAEHKQVQLMDQTMLDLGMDLLPKSRMLRNKMVKGMLEIQKRE